MLTDTMTANRAPKGRHGGVPSFFRGLCWEASRGGNSSYRTAAYELTRHIGWREMPDDVDDDEWQQELSHLSDLVCPPLPGPEGFLVVPLDEPDVDGVWQWFRDHYPKCMKLVPARRKHVFVSGVRAAFDDEIVNF